MTDHLISTVVTNGVPLVCDPGCSNCIIGICKSCSEGYVYLQNIRSCFKCADNCASCDPNNHNKCDKCINGAYLADNSCLPCDASCITC